MAPLGTRYIDGACYPPRRPRIVATTPAPVWHPSEQTSGAAEWTALCGIVQILQSSTVVYTDYAALVRA